MKMDALPDEIMLLILSNIKDGLTLLDAVPLVCKRWHRLAADWRAWTGVKLEVDVCNWIYPPEKVNTLDLARVLLHAPALGCLTIADWNRDRGAGFDLFLSALRRTRAALLGLEMYSCYFMYADGLRALYELMWRSRNLMRTLVLELPAEWHPDDFSDDSEDELLEDDDMDAVDGGLDDANVTVTLDGQEVSLMGILAQLQRLETLTVTLRNTFPYDEELQGIRLPHLKALHLQADLEYGRCSYAVDLLDSASTSLRVLELPSLPAPREVVAAASRCVGLRFLNVALVDVTVCAEMRELRSLCLSQEGYAFKYAKRELKVDHVRAAHQALHKAADALRGLSSLDINLWQDEDAWVHCRSELKLLALETLRAAKNVTRLTLQGELLKGLLGELQLCAPCVRHLAFDTSGTLEVAMVAPLAALASLHTLRLNRPWTDDTDKLRAHAEATDEFRRLRPSVVLLE